MKFMKLIVHHEAQRSIMSHRKIHRSQLRKKTVIAFSLFSSEQVHLRILDESRITADFQVSWQRL
jgi:hypothetical protein